jgi:transcriptional regulator with XRE-family HTH domain
MDPPVSPNAKKNGKNIQKLNYLVYCTKFISMSQSFAGKNLKFLRKKIGMTQEEFAQKLQIKRSLLGAYEEERAEPRLDVLEMVSDHFGITLDDLLRTDLGGDGVSYLSKRRQQKMSSDIQKIHFVPVKAAAGYLAGYADEEFIDELNTFTLPMLGSGQFRAFEIIGDSMLPTPSGSIIVGQKMENLDDVGQHSSCIVVSRSEGIVYKRVSFGSGQKSKVTLTSDNPTYQPYEVNAEDILEVWQGQVVITKVAQQQRWDVGQLANLVSNLQEQVSSIRKRMN